MEDAALIIFVRNPVLGKVKTRLAATLGSTKALAIYEALLKHTRLVTQDLSVNKFVYYEDYINDNDLWNGYTKRSQIGNDLGERMVAAFKEIFLAGYTKVCVIGSDCLELTTDIIIEAFIKLKKFEIVIGPATDGGYYTIGMNNDHTGIFNLNNWGSSDVYNDTVSIIKENKLSFTNLKMLTDVDLETDLPEGWLF